MMFPMRVAALGATPTQFVSGQRYSISFVNGPGAPSSPAQAQAQLNTFLPNATKVVGIDLGSHVTVTFDWVGPTQPTSILGALASSVVSLPVSVNAPNAPATSSSTVLYLGISAGVLALGGLSWYYLMRNQGRQRSRRA